MSGEAAVYLDSSALVKLVVLESGSEALVSHLRQRTNRVSCGLARVEVIRAVSSHGQPAITRARRLLERISLVRLDDVLLDDAATLKMMKTVNLRSLDAIHLAGARALGEGLAEVLTYDRRMADAAEMLGMTVVAPV